MMIRLQAGGVWFVGVGKYAGQQLGAMLAVIDPALGPEQVRSTGFQTLPRFVSTTHRRTEVERPNMFVVVF